MNNNSPPRTFEGRAIDYRRVVKRHWTGGHGYYYEAEYQVWNPKHPERKLTLSQEQFLTLTEQGPCCRAA